MLSPIIDPNNRAKNGSRRILSPVRSAMFVLSGILLMMSFRLPLTTAAALLATSAGVLGIVATRLLRQVDKYQKISARQRRIWQTQTILAERLEKHVREPYLARRTDGLRAQREILDVPGVWLPTRTAEPTAPTR